MSVQCEACLRKLTEDKPVRHGEMPEGHVVNDAKYEEIDAAIGQVITDLEFRTRPGLAMHLKRVRSWFRFHGGWIPSLPAKLLENEAPRATVDIYNYVRLLCEHLAEKPWADEIHLNTCAANRELVREVVRLGSR
jgi:hypothetical protein